jgi:hypothetical protein
MARLVGMGETYQSYLTSTAVGRDVALLGQQVLRARNGF